MVAVLRMFRVTSVLGASDDSRGGQDDHRNPVRRRDVSVAPHNPTLSTITTIRHVKRLLCVCGCVVAGVVYLYAWH